MKIYNTVSEQHNIFIMIQETFFPRDKFLCTCKLCFQELLAGIIVLLSTKNSKGNAYMYIIIITG